MLITLIRKEILEAFLSLRFLIATLLCVTLIPLGIYVNLKEYQKRMTDYQESVRLYLERSKGNLGGEFPAEGYRPPSALSIFSVGLEYFLPNKIVTSRDGDVQTSNVQGIDNPQSLLFGKVDLYFNVNYVISLLALIFTFSAITGEKEDGTLKLMLANPLPRWKIILAKITGNYIVLLVPFCLSILISLIIIAFSGILPVFSSGVFGSFLVIFLITLLYILAMFNLGILASTFTHRSLTSIVSLLFVWAILILSLPKISPMIAEAVYPVKSQQVFDIQKSMARENSDSGLRKRLGGLWKTLAPAYGMDPNTIYSGGKTDNEKHFLDVYDSVKSTIETEYNTQLGNELKKLAAEYTGQRRTQEAIAMNLSRLSPASCYAYIVSEISATGTMAVDNFARNADRYQSEVKESIYDKIRIKTRYSEFGMSSSVDYAPGFKRSDLRVPQLTYRHTTLADALRSEWADIALILIFNTLFFYGSYTRFMKYDVR